MPTRLTWPAVALAAFGAPCTAQPMASEPSAVVRFDGHKAVRVTVHTLRELRTALALTDDVWTCAGVGIGSWDARFSPEQFTALRLSGIPFEVLEENIQAGIDEMNARLRAGGAAGRDGPWFADYKNPVQISDYVDELVALRPDLASRRTLGQSLEGRDIYAIRICNDAHNPGRCKPGLLIHGTQHAREWITPMTVMYAADRLVRDYDTDPYLHDLVDRVEIWIIPVFNPDGYQHTWSVNANWRKNRRNNGDGSFGVDNNRNWGHEWGGPGASANPSSEIYRGPAPFSEPENRVFRDFVLAHPNIRSHNDVHSYGQLILWPWGYTPQVSPHEPTFGAIGQIMRARILAVHGRDYRPGPVYTNIYPASGVSVDWMYGDQGIYALSFEMRGGGFHPSPTQILPGAEEAFPALMYQAEWIAAEFPFRADINDDCRYTIDDYIGFQTAFALGDPRADLDGSGSLNVNDFTAFQTAFALRR